MTPTRKPDAEAALDKAFELASRLNHVMQGALSQRGLTASRAEVLLVLHHGGPMVQRALSQVLRCTARNVTGLVDALEAQGLAKRTPHPTDRRATVVSLTKRGATAAARMGSERLEAARALLGDVPAADLAAFMAVADQLLDRMASADASEASDTGGHPARARRGRPEDMAGADVP